MAAKKASVSRRRDNRLDEPFGLVFFEWFPGSPRWLNEREYDQVVRYLPPLDREPEVKEKAAVAHRSPYDAHAFIVSCVNPNCSNRKQIGWTAAQLADRASLRSKLAWEVAKIAGEDDSDLLAACDTCGQKCFVFVGRQVADAWIYVFREAGGALVPHCEVFVGPEGMGDIRYRFDKGSNQFRDERRQAFHGTLKLEDLTEHTWHFFHCRVQLRGRSMKEICAMRPASKKSPRGMWSHQPYQVTVKRRFTHQQITENINRLNDEIIPVTNPFDWVEKAILVDAYPVLETLDELRSNANEQAKLYISGTLSVLMARRLVKEGPPPEYETDKFDLRDDTIPVPSKYAACNDIAQAWITRYQEAHDYLARETDKAFERVFDVVRYAPAHRIVEMACQDSAAGDPSQFRYGLTHWADVLKFSLMSKQGGLLLEWLDQDADAAETIPVRNVKGKAGVDWPSLMEDEDISRLAHFILSFLLPRLISNRGSADAAARAVSEILNVFHPGSTQASGSKIAKAFKESGKVAKKGLPKIGDSAIELYWKRIADKEVGGSLDDLKKNSNTKKYIEAGTHGLELVIDVATLYITYLDFVKAWNQKSKADEDWWVPVDRAKKLAEPFQKVPDFVMKQIRQVMKSNIKKKAAKGVEKQTYEELSKIISKMEEKGLRSLSEHEIERVTNFRIMRSYAVLWRAGKVLTGWGGMLFGGLSLITDTGKAVNAWEAGDPGATVGMGLVAASNVGFMIAAGADIYMLHLAAAGGAAAGGAAAGGAAGMGAIPIVGWVSLAVLATGLLIYTFCSKNELEKFTQHCWLGSDYGQGDWGDEADVFWMGKKPWPWLRYDGQGDHESPARWMRQGTALRRLISRYSVIMANMDWCGGTILVSSLPETACFEVEITVIPTDGYGGKRLEDRRKTFRAYIWPLAKDWVWEENDDFRFLDKSRVEFREKYLTERLNNIAVQAIPKDTRNADYEMRVRLDIGDGEYVPASGNSIRVTSSHLGRRDSTDYS